MNSRIMNYNGQVYHIREIEIRDIILIPDNEKKRTQLKVTYKGGKFEDYAYSVPHNVSGNINTQHLGAIMYSLLKRNRLLIADKEEKRVRV